jgi:hypothetical protein
MAGVGEKLDSVRVSRFEGKRLALALALSLAAHFLVWGGYEVGKNSGLWQRLHWPKWLQHVAKIKPPAQPVAQPAEPEIFLDVSQPSTEAPKNAKYYSAKNSVAANPDADQNSVNPKLNGKQTDVPKTQTTPRSHEVKAQTPPPTPTAKPSPEESQPKATEPVGNMTLAKANPTPDPDQLHPDRPRTLNEARAQLAKSRPDLMMQQDGGTRRHAIVPAFDVSATPFGDYDAAVFDAIQQCWDDELAKINYSGAQIGKVALEFNLHQDGRITDMKVLETTVGETMTAMCQLAVINPGPYAPWPTDMRRKNDKDFRKILLTFYYY